MKIPWPLVAVGLVILVALWFPFGFHGTSNTLRATQDSVRTLEPIRDSLRASNAILGHRSDSLAHVVRETQRVAAEQQAGAEAKITAATARALATAGALRAQLDSTEAQMFADYEADRDSIETAMGEELDAVEALNAALWAERSTFVELVAGLRDELAAERAIGAQLHSANEALRDAIMAERQQVWLSRGAATIAVVGVLLLK